MAFPTFINQERSTIKAQTLLCFHFPNDDLFSWVTLMRSSAARSSFLTNAIAIAITVLYDDLRFILAQSRASSSSSSLWSNDGKPKRRAFKTLEIPDLEFIKKIKMSL